MKILRWHYAKQFLMLAFGMLVLFLVVFVSIDIVDRPASYGQTWAEFGVQLWIKTADLFYPMLAIALFLAHVVILSVMYLRREALLLGITGIGVWTVYRPVIFLTLVCMGIGHVVHDTVYPPVVRLQRLRDVPRTVVRVDILDSGLWYRFPDAIYWFGQVQGQSQRMDDVYVMRMDSEQQVTEIIRAKHASVHAYEWLFQEGQRLELQKGVPLNVSHFATYQRLLPQRWEDVNKITTHPDQLRFDQLVSGLWNGKFRTNTLHQYQTAALSRLVFVVMPLLLLFVSAPLIALRGRQVRVMWRAFLAVVLCAIFWVTHHIAVSMGYVGTWHPLMAVLLVPGFFLGVGGLLWSFRNKRS